MAKIGNGTEIKKNEKNIKTKQNILARKATVMLTILVILLGVDWVILKRLLGSNARKNKEVSSLENSKREIMAETIEFDKRSLMLQTYIDVWTTHISDTQKNLDDLNVQDIDTFLRDITTRHLATDIKITMSTPEIINEVGNRTSRKNMNVMGLDITVSFNCMTEYTLYYFLEELKRSNIGFPVVHEFTIKKSKNLDKKFIETLINGDIPYIFNVSVKLQWYKFINKKI
ncbi:MAG: hypothetical protein LBQ13_03845 [Endomicrobium sp.]|jgi:hypothetical protein|nr:hypothetical protein [Endomicrobium sp.]